MSGKDLKSMTLEELWELFPITLVDPRAEEWKRSYLKEEKTLKAICHGLLERVSHVGSTAVGTIKAKPIVDIIAEVADGALERCAALLEENGYIVMSRAGDRISLNKGYTRPE